VWEHFSHPADIGVRGIGKTLEEAFAEGAYALVAVMCDPKTVAPTEPIDILCESLDVELLFCDWLSTLIYEMDSRKMLLSQFNVSIDGTQLWAKAWGEKIDPLRHAVAVEVKAATYMELKVCKTDAGQWLAQCVVDV
jgi:tRNA nucleotidyltransferase (CCA-adding enzyme)